MAISDKLQELLDIKQDIKTAIENKGVDMTGGSQGETWVINESPNTNYFSFDVSFISNEQPYVNLRLEGDLHITGIVYNLPNLQGYVIAYENGNDGYYWTYEAYRTITFETAPTGDLLTWLQANAVKQTTGVAFAGYAGKIDLLPAVVELTQAQYDALSVYDNNTYYLIVEA